MSAYVLVEVSVTDREKMMPYIEAVDKTVTNHGGKYLVRSPDAEVVEGNIGQHPLKVLLEFPDMAKAKAWYASPEYQAIIPFRTDNSQGNMLFVNGV